MTAYWCLRHVRSPCRYRPSLSFGARSRSTIGKTSMLRRWLGLQFRQKSGRQPETARNGHNKGTGHQPWYGPGLAQGLQSSCSGVLANCRNCRNCTESARLRTHASKHVLCSITCPPAPKLQWKISQTTYQASRRGMGRGPDVLLLRPPARPTPPAEGLPVNSRGCGAAVPDLMPPL